MNILLSFHYYRDADLDELLGQFPEPPNVFADSGAYSAMSVGADIQLHEYVAWLTRWRHHLTTYVNLDVIGDPVATWENQQRMEQDHDLHPVPVFHAGSPWEYLERYLERYRYIALGGMVGTAGLPALTRHAVRCFRLAEGTGVGFHGFGMTKLPLLRSLPWYSVDSSSWAAGQRYGTLNLWSDDRRGWVKVRIGTRETITHARLIRAHGGDPIAMSQPGFAQAEVFGVDEGRRQRAMVIGVNVTAWLRLEQWLRRHHGVIQPEGLEEGPMIYLAAGGGGMIDGKPQLALPSIRSIPSGPIIYLATAFAFNQLLDGLHAIGMMG